MNTNLHPQLQKCHEKYNFQNNSPLFDYSETVFNNYKIKIKIKCLKCNTLFEQRIDKHLEGQKGNCMCRPVNQKEKAALIRAEKKKQKLIESEKAALIRAEKRKQRLIEKEERKIAALIQKQNKLPLFIKKAQTINNNINEFNYDKVEFKTIGKYRWALNIKCNKCSLLFDQRTDKHLEGQGCKRCRSHMHDIETYRGRPTTLYYIKVDNLYKIGLTMRTVKSRFSEKENSSLIQEIKTWSFENGEEAYILEQKIISSYSHLKYNYQKYGEILKAGNSELFTENIFEEIVPLIELF